MNEIQSSMEEVNAKVAELGQPVVQTLTTTQTHTSDPWGTVYKEGEQYFVVLGVKTLRLNW